MPPNLGQQLGRVGLVEHDRTGRPAIFESETVEFVEQAGKGHARKAGDGQCAQMLLAQLRFQPARQRLIGQQRIEMHGRLGHADTLAPGRNRAVQIGQRLGIIEPANFGHETFDQVQDAVAAVGKAPQQFPRIDAGVRPAFVEPAFSSGRIFRRRHPQ